MEEKRERGVPSPPGFNNRNSALRGYDGEFGDEVRNQDVHARPHSRGLLLSQGVLPDGEGIGHDQWHVRRVHGRGLEGRTSLPNAHALFGCHDRGFSNPDDGDAIDGPEDMSTKGVTIGEFVPTRQGADDSSVFPPDDDGADRASSGVPDQFGFGIRQGVLPRLLRLCSPQVANL